MGEAPTSENHKRNEIQRIFLSEADDKSGWWLWLLGIGILAGLPFLIFEYLPLVDFPLHQLALAIWTEEPGANTHYAQYYETAPYSLPYWFPSMLSSLFVPFWGVEWASRILLFIYVATLPLAAGFAARSCKRSGWWGLLVVPFVFEYNLAWGFVSYCFAGLLGLLCISIMLRAEKSCKLNRLLFMLLLVSIMLGWSHPQMPVMIVGVGALLQCFNFGVPIRKRALLLLPMMACLLPSLFWFSRPGEAEIAFVGTIEFAPFGVLLPQFSKFSVDVFPGPLEESLFILSLLIVLTLWWLNPTPITFKESRFLFVGLFFLAGYLFAPWNWNGQAICQRMPYLWLIFLPLMVPPLVYPSLRLKALLVVFALLGASHTGLNLHGFHQETKEKLAPLIDIVPPNSKTAYVTYDPDSPWVNAPVYLHTGAWITLRKGGVYSFNFNRLTSHYRSNVPEDNLLIGHEFYFKDYYQRTGQLSVVPRHRFSYWDTILIRWPADEQPTLPFEAKADDIQSSDIRFPWGIVQLSSRSD